MCVLAALLLYVAGGAAGAISGSGYNFENDEESQIESTQDTQKLDLSYLKDGISSEDIKRLIIDLMGGNSDLPEEDQATLLGVFAVIGSVAAGFLLIVITIGVIITAFILNPLHVGARKFFTENQRNSGTKIEKSNIGFGFDSNYMRIVKTMFSTQFFVFLWSLLLIIPGVIKNYQWRMVPFLLGENPDLTGSEAREMSAQIMNGNKMAAFVLDLSFIGWIFLGGLTFGILNIFWTNPYKAAADSELFLTLHHPEVQAAAIPAEAEVVVD